jgi:hypothetical protein
VGTVVVCKNTFWGFWRLTILFRKQRVALTTKKTCGLPAACVIPTKVFKLMPEILSHSAKLSCSILVNSNGSVHFAWADNGTHIAGLTATGRATVLALQLNNPYAVTVREAWVSAGWHPPTETSEGS